MSHSPQGKPWLCLCSEDMRFATPWPTDRQMFINGPFMQRRPAAMQRAREEGEPSALMTVIRGGVYSDSVGS